MRGDVGNFSHVLNLIERIRPTTVYHLGGMLSAPSDDDPAGSFQANAAGTFHVLEAAKLFGVSQVIFASTGGTYGDDIEEDIIDDVTLQRPQLFYGATKLFGELAGRFYGRKYGLDFRAMTFTLFAPKRCEERQQSMAVFPTPITSTFSPTESTCPK